MKLAKRLSGALLPDNWAKRNDEFGRTFYWNKVTNKVTYEWPQPISGAAAGWKERRDPASSQVYHYNTWTRSTRSVDSVDRPAPPMQLPADPDGMTTTDDAVVPPWPPPPPPGHKGLWTPPAQPAGPPLGELPDAPGSHQTVAALQPTELSALPRRLQVEYSHLTILQPPPLQAPGDEDEDEDTTGAVVKEGSNGGTTGGSNGGSNCDNGSGRSAGINGSGRSASGRSADTRKARLALAMAMDALSGRPMVAKLERFTAGLYPGDLLLAVNGQRPLTVEAAEALLLRQPPRGCTAHDLEVVSAAPSPDASRHSVDRGQRSSTLDEDLSSLSSWHASNRRSSGKQGERVSGFL